MKSTLLLSLLLLCGSVSAQEKTAAQKLLDVTRYEETAVKSAVAAFDGLISQLRQQGIPEKAIEEIRLEAVALYTKIFSDPAIRKSTEDLYTKNFTEEEMLELVKFYNTPVGQKSLTVTPTITADVMKTVLPSIQKEMPAFQQKVGDIVKKHQQPAAEKEGE